MRRLNEYEEAFVVARVKTVAFHGIEALTIDVQVQIAGGLPAITLVGLPDKVVAESRERVAAALRAIGLGLPPKRIIVNLAPGDILKEGSHFDLPIALGIMAAIGALDPGLIDRYVVLGELALDGAISPVSGVLPASVHAAMAGWGLICPASSGPEAAWAADDAGPIDVVAAASLIALVNHLKGDQILAEPPQQVEEVAEPGPDLADIKGQEVAKRALEVAAAGGHNLLLAGPPGTGKSMLAARLPGLLPPLEPAEALEVSMIHSVAGRLTGGRLLRRRPYRSPHHSSSMPALVGGGSRARPGEISLAHRGVLFLDELPEFPRPCLEALRQPLETGQAFVSRANISVSYPARFQLVAAMNPCRCGYLGDPDLGCGRAPRCAVDYQARISGPMFDRIDMHIDVPAVSFDALDLPPPTEGSDVVAARVAAARARQRRRYGDGGPGSNAEADGKLLEEVAAPEAAGRALLRQAAEQMRLSARGYHRVLRVGRTLADLDGAETVARRHIAEALSYRRLAPTRS